MKYFVFDLDDTLYLRSEVFVNACFQMFPELKGQDPQKLYQIRKKYSDISFDLCSRSQLTQREMHIYRTLKTFAEYDLSLNEEQALAFEDLYASLQGQISLPPFMERSLAFLKENQIPMAIITNGSKDRQMKKLEALSLTRYIPREHFFISGEIGAEKPDPKIFHFAEKKLGILPQDAWFIGDAFEADIVGASKAGWKTIFLNHRLETPGNEVSPDYTVTSFEDFFKLLTGDFKRFSA